MESGNAPAASLPRSCATWLPWNRYGPVYTSRSPDLWSSLGHHRQSISGLRRSCTCCRSWSLRTSLAILILVLGLSLVSHVLVVTVLPAVSVLIHWSSAHTLLTESHFTRTAWCQPGIRSQVSEEKKLTSQQVFKSRSTLTTTTSS